MTDNPTPTNPPALITDWAAWSAEKMRALHPAKHIECEEELSNACRDQLDEVERIADDLQDIHFENVAAWRELWPDIDDNFHFPIERARAERDALRSRLTLTDEERKTIAHARAMYTAKTVYHLDMEITTADLVTIIDRLTRADGGR